MATIEKSANNLGFNVRWTKNECDKQDQNKYDVIETEPATVNGYNELICKGKHVTNTTTYGVVAPRLSGSVQTNQGTTRNIDGRKRNILGQEEFGGCQLNENSSNKPAIKIPPFNQRNPSVPRPIQLVAPISHVDSDNARACLANALQCHIKDLVDGLLFSESELADTLTSGGCLTDEENSRMRNMRCRKDQIRVLVYLIKGRDFKVMDEFIKQITPENPVLAKKIMNKFEKNKQDGIMNTVCTLCKLICNCDVKDVIDNLWGCQLIPDDLYTTICHSDKPVGGQYDLWIALVKSLRSLKGKKIKLADEQLVNALRAKGVFSYLAEKVNIGHLVCLCKSKGTPRNRYSSTSSSSDESCYPDSSCDSTPPVDGTTSD